MPHRVYLANQLPAVLDPVVNAFGRDTTRFSASDVTKVTDVRELVADDLRRAGWVVADGGRRDSGIPLAREGEGVVRADATRREDGAALWIETGRSWMNNGFLEHLFEAIPCPAAMHVAVAVRTIYGGQAAYDKIVQFLDPVMASPRLDLPFRSVVIVGY